MVRIFPDLFSAQRCTICGRGTENLSLCRFCGRELDGRTDELSREMGYETFWEMSQDIDLDMRDELLHGVYERMREDFSPTIIRLIQKVSKFLDSL